jgi:hypothetical protein
LPRALFVAKQYVDFPELSKEHIAIRAKSRASSGWQYLGAQSILKSAGILEEDRLYGLEDVKIFQAHFTAYQIIVISKSFFDSVVFCGPIKDKKLVIYEVDKHFHTITKFKSFFADMKYFCFECMERYDKFRGHTECCKRCNLCLHSECYHSSYDLEWEYCADCNRYFKNSLCLKLHYVKPTEKALCVCKKYIKCEKCSKVIERFKREPAKHQCGLQYCKSCKQWCSDMADHNCFIKPIKLDKKVDGEKKSILNFFDFECDQATGEHVPTLIVLQNEGGECWVFREKDKCLDKFCEFIFTDQFRSTVFISHYGSNYDLYFVANYLNKTSTYMDTIYRETSIMQIVVPCLDIVFKDSYLFIPTKLSAFPSMFGFEGAKTYFPHFFPYSDYTGDYVAKEYYGYDGMKTSDRIEFLLWYEDKKAKGEQFSYLNDLETYCINDVTLLRKACQTFRDIFIEGGYTDPWAEAVTLTHACSIVYRKCFMPRETLALIPHSGYTSPKTFSTKGIKWLEYLSNDTSTYISHARNDKERRVLDRYYCDGWSSKDGVITVYEYNGVSIQI